MQSGRRDALADEALVVAAQGGDRRALDDLVAAYLPLVYNIVGRALDGHADVDDVVQETLVRAIERLTDLRDPAAFRSWLAAIAIRCVRDRWRVAQVRPVAGADGGWGVPPDTADPGADFVDLTILRLELSGQRRETALATRWLDPDDRELLALWWLEAAGEMSRAELVEALGLTAGHTSVRVQRMKQQLETARTVVRALAAVPRCGELFELAHRWDGRPSSAWRKQFGRHTRECVQCSVHTQGLVPTERLLAGLALVSVPVLIAARWSALIAAHSSAGTAMGSARHAAGHANRPGWLAAHGSAKLVAVVAGVVAVAGAGIVYASAGTSARRQVVAAPAVTPSTHPSASTTSAVPTPPPSSRSTSATTPSAPHPTSASPSPGLTTSKLGLPSALSYLSSGYNEMPEWTRIDTETAPDGSVQVAWPGTDGVHVTPLTAALQRRGPDVVVAGAREVGGLVAQNDGFALLTRVPDSNKWGDTAAALVRYRNGAQVFIGRLTGSASNDTAPVLDGSLKWNGTEYGAYFVVHGAGGFADGHYGDKLVYVNGNGAAVSGGWDWGCNHNEGIALYPEASAPFTSLCFDDWRSGLFVSTGIGAPDEAPVVQREQCWAGYCGGDFPGNAGAIVKSPSGRYATAFASRGSASAAKNPADSSGRGWTVTPRTGTHQVAVAFLKDGSTPAGSPVLLTDEPGTDHVNVHIAPLPNSRLLVSWEDVLGASCNAGTCTGKFGGTHLRVIDWSGRAQGADQVVDARIAGDIAALPDGSLVWAYVDATPDYSGPLSSSPTSSTLTIAKLVD
ncbi:sigma-70 family RNA polymerase sigma factor [Catenulispora rubra]|uniref:sigma-70 family RNA polymerase sigma factor n=1 Tax=Catenulispora rubra TaxID=280293 RepID=UPI0018927F0E|nr:sigma-70 family RNA polymerase sigma factor [Catenulispora rubra]